jgi:hypothetical protein
MAIPNHSRNTNKSVGQQDCANDQDIESATDTILICYRSGIFVSVHIWHHSHSGSAIREYPIVSGGYHGLSKLVFEESML